MAKRTTISKRLRFEVFKRDSFKCQYCGRSAPEVLLHVDHIKPVAADGETTLVNLVTACVDCNLGKSSIPLSDSTAVQKAKRQLDLLQERREQIEMMVEWQKGLSDIESDTLDQVHDFWKERVYPFVLNETGIANLRKLLKQNALSDVLAAISEATSRYIVREDDGTPTSQSVEIAFNKVCSICYVVKASADDSDVKELYYIRGIVRNKCAYFNPRQALEILEAVRSWGVPFDRMKKACTTVRNWTHFRTLMHELIEEFRQESGE